MYRPETIRRPSVDELSEISKEKGLHCTAQELAVYKEFIGALLDDYDEVDQLIPPTLPVKYPRAPGYRPTPEDNKYNAWYWRCDIQGAQGGLLHGKRIAVKDNICVAGIPMMNGSRLMEDFVPVEDATVVTRVLDAGGTIIGKTNCEHLCFDGGSWSNDIGPTLNPNNPNCSSGGSSSGSAVVVHTGEADMAIGGDQAGSIRIPSSWCGVVGLKPTWGLVPYTGAVSIEITCDHLGPMAKTVKDCAILLEVIAGYDAGRDPRQPGDIKVPKYSELLETRLPNFKVGLLKEGFEGCDQNVQTIVRNAAMKLRETGAEVEEISVPLHAKGKAIWTPIILDGTYKCMVQGNGSGLNYKGHYSIGIIDKLRSGYNTMAGNLSETMKVECLVGEFLDKNYGNKMYAKAQNLNFVLAKAYNDALSKYDVLVMPTLPYTAPPVPSADSLLKDRLVSGFGMIKNTSPFDCTGHPALTINAGYCTSLPVGMMIVGKHFDETSILRAAYAVEQLELQKA